MSASSVARRHFQAAMEEAAATGQDPDAVARQLLSLVVQQYRKTRPLKDIEAELRTLAENVDPDTDYAFMRP